MTRHIADARKKVGRPQIREVFLRNGAVIPADRDDLPDWVYESVFELLDSVIQQAGPAIQYVAPAVQGGPVACVPDQAKNERQATLSVDSERQAPDVSALVEALDLTELRKLLLILRGNIGGAMWTLDDEEEELAVRTEKAIDAIAALAAHRKQQEGQP